MELNNAKIKEIIAKNFKWIVLFICVIGFLSLAEDVFKKEIMRGDIIGYKFISTYLISDVATPIAKVITSLGGATCLIIISTILLICIKNKKIGISICANLLIITILNLLLKYIIYLIYKYVKNKYLKYITITIFSILIISIGISRIYLGVHYTSDVLAGFFISISYLILYTSMINKFVIGREE